MVNKGSTTYAEKKDGRVLVNRYAFVSQHVPIRSKTLTKLCVRPRFPVYGSILKYLLLITFLLSKLYYDSEDPSFL